MTIIQSTPLLASFMTLVLALMALLNRRHSRMHVALALLMFTLSVASFLSYWSRQITDIEAYHHLLRFSIFVNSTEFFMIVYFTLVLTGFIDRHDEKIAGMAPLTFIKVLPPTLLVSIFMIGFTDIFVQDIFYKPDGSLDIRYSPWMFPIESIAILFVILVIIVISKALKESQPGYHKAFLRQIASGIFIILLAGPLLGILVPMMGFDSGPMLDISVVIASVIFYLALNRYQFDTINELNINLEHKVEERTKSLRQAQSQLVQSEKMASLGRLVAGFAHEINNPIGAVQSANATLEQSLNKLETSLQPEDGEETSGQTDKILTVMKELVRVNKLGAKRVADMVEKMKAFVQLDESELQNADINEGITTTIELFSGKTDNRISFQQELAELPPINCNPAKLNQVFWQIFDNAAKAMNGEGEIRVRTSLQDDHIQIEITDSGRGIAEQDLEKIFEPGFTNWSVGVGVGLGLSICYQIIQEHQGTISVESGPGKGARFVISLPII